VFWLGQPYQWEETINSGYPPFPDTDSGSLFHFPQHCRIGHFRKFISIYHKVTGCFSQNSAKWCRQGNESTTFGSDSADSRIRRNPEIRIRIPDHLIDVTKDLELWLPQPKVHLALAELCIVRVLSTINMLRVYLRYLVGNRGRLSSCHNWTCGCTDVNKDGKLQWSDFELARDVSLLSLPCF